MKKKLKLLGIIALSAIIALGMISCDDEGDFLEGTVSIQLSSFGAYTTKPLTAVYTGTESVSFQWNLAGAPVANATNATFTPTEAGAYTVTVSLTGFTPENSKSVEIYVAPAWVDFFGTWFMDGTLSGNTITGNVNETVIISNNSFNMTSTATPAGTFNFTIDKWDAIPTTEVTVGTTTFSGGFKLTGESVATGGYSEATIINLFMSAGKLSFVRTTGDGSTTVIGPRVYVRQN